MNDEGVIKNKADLKKYFEYDAILQFVQENPTHFVRGQENPILYENF